MRDEGRRRSEMLAPFAAEDAPEVVETFAGGQAHGIDALVAPRIDQVCGAALRFRAPVAFDLDDRRTTCLQRVAQQLAASVTAEDHDSFSRDVEKLGQREQAFA